MSAPLTYQRIEDAIRDAINRQETLTIEFAEHGDNLAETEWQYRHAFAAARIACREAHIGSKVTVDVVDDTAVVTTIAEREALEVARVKHEATKQALYSVRARLEALRSLMASHRGATGDG